MLNKIYILLGGAVIVIAIWAAVHAFQNNPQHNAASLFQIDFLSAISRQVTGGLSLGNTTSPAEVSVDELGELSPLAGMITIEKDVFTIKESTPATEYITLHASKRNAQPINISNWSLQSMISDVWIGLPQGAATYVAGDVNPIEDIYLAPGERAIISTGPSPIGISFKVNRCSGYLASTQSFTPRLTTSCINPQAVLPPTVENIRTYGDACVRLVENLPRCTYITSKSTGFGETSTLCRTDIQPRLTYNGCVSDVHDEQDFYAAKEWRIFLNQNTRAWKDSYEVIRLLDDHNRTVDVFNY